MSLILYRKQREILQFLKEFITTHGFAPTIREIANALGLSSPATIEEHLQALERKGVILRIRGKKRAISISSEFQQLPESQIPIIGQIAAGEPIEAIEDPQSSIRFHSRGDISNLFALRVKGHSMIEDGILDGDIVIIHRQESCSEGETVVALLEDGSATLKRCYRERDRIRLQPANPEFQPIYVDSLHIQGKVIGLVRNF